MPLLAWSRRFDSRAARPGPLGGCQGSKELLDSLRCRAAPRAAQGLRGARLSPGLTWEDGDPYVGWTLICEAPKPHSLKPTRGFCMCLTSA